MPRYQGELDGLCGIYAVANAFEFGFGKNANASFEVCCDSLASRRWPAVMWEGTYFGDIMRMVAACRRHHRLRLKMRIRVPFWKSLPSDNADYWKKFDKLMDREEVHCALVGISKPFYHWIIATKHKSGILFLDSTAGETLSLKKRSELFAGGRRPNGSGENVWLVNPRELITFETRTR